jgi:hypothetical protein
VKSLEGKGKVRGDENREFELGLELLRQDRFGAPRRLGFPKHEKETRREQRGIL